MSAVSDAGGAIAAGAAMGGAKTVATTCISWKNAWWRQQSDAMDTDSVAVRW